MSPSDDKFILLLEKIAEVNERVVRMEVQQLNMKEDLGEVRKQDLIQNDLLAEHIRGVQTANARLDVELRVIENLEKRIATLEETPKFFSTAKKIALWISAIVGAVYAVSRLFGKS